MNKVIVWFFCVIVFALGNFCLIHAQNAVNTFINQIENLELENELAFETFSTSINSELNEIGLCRFRNKFLVLSNSKRRHYKRTLDVSSNAYNNNIFCLNITSQNDLVYPLLFSKILDSDFQEGSITFSPDEKYIYYTKSNPLNLQNLSLYRAEFDENINGYWKDITLLFGGVDFSIETPFVSKDGTELFFASNKNGGFGGFDLYVAKLEENGRLGEIKNLGENVNTQFDEKYPFCNEKHLYFSSNGHEGFGGYDVFRIFKNSNLNFQKAINLGSDLNTKVDEIAFLPFDESEGYFSRNRILNNVNFDIYHFKMSINHTENNIEIPKVVPNDVNINVVVEAEEINSRVENVFFVENILFQFDDYQLLSESNINLNKIVNYLKANPKANLEINAHTDSKGSEEYNLRLSQLRAKSTFEYISNAGIDKSRLIYKGLGESNPLVNCDIYCSDEQHKKNRRVEFLVHNR